MLTASIDCGLLVETQPTGEKSSSSQETRPHIARTGPHPPGNSSQRKCSSGLCLLWWSRCCCRCPPALHPAPRDLWDPLDRLTPLSQDSVEEEEHFKLEWNTGSIFSRVSGLYPLIGYFAKTKDCISCSNTHQDECRLASCKAENYRWMMPKFYITPRNRGRDMFYPTQHLFSLARHLLSFMTNPIPFKVVRHIPEKSAPLATMKFKLIHSLYEWLLIHKYTMGT